MLKQKPSLVIVDWLCMPLISKCYDFVITISMVPYGLAGITREHILVYESFSAIFFISNAKCWRLLFAYFTLQMYFHFDWWKLFFVDFSNKVLLFFSCNLCYLIIWCKPISKISRVQSGQTVVIYIFATTANYYDCYHRRFLSYHNHDESHIRVQKNAANAIFHYPFLYHSIRSLDTKVVIKFHVVHCYLWWLMNIMVSRARMHAHAPHVSANVSVTSEKKKCLSLFFIIKNIFFCKWFII